MFFDGLLAYTFFRDIWSQNWIMVFALWKYLAVLQLLQKIYHLLKALYYLSFIKHKKIGHVVSFTILIIMLNVLYIWMTVRTEVWEPLGPFYATRVKLYVSAHTDIFYATRATGSLFSAINLFVALLFVEVLNQRM